MTAQVKPTARDVQRLQTRERILGAAIAEFKRSGMADAEVNSIAAAAGVAHGTFYFHFPTKEHVLLELEQREEARVAAQFERFLAGPHDLAGALAEVVALVQDIERRFGSPLFRELVALHFSPSRPVSENWTDHPVIVQLVREIELARAHGTVHPEVDPFSNAVFFLLGVYGVLSAGESADTRDGMLEKLVASALRGLEIR